MDDLPKSNPLRFVLLLAFRGIPGFYELPSFEGPSDRVPAPERTKA